MLQEKLLQENAYDKIFVFACVNWRFLKLGELLQGYISGKNIERQAERRRDSKREREIEGENEGEKGKKV